MRKTVWFVASTVVMVAVVLIMQQFPLLPHI
jgi:hypothetical protein